MTEWQEGQEDQEEQIDNKILMALNRTRANSLTRLFLLEFLLKEEVSVASIEEILKSHKAAFVANLFIAKLNYSRIFTKTGLRIKRGENREILMLINSKSKQFIYIPLDIQAVSQEIRNLRQELKEALDKAIQAENTTETAEALIKEYQKRLMEALTSNKILKTKILKPEPLKSIEKDKKTEKKPANTAAYLNGEAPITALKDLAILISQAISPILNNSDSSKIIKELENFAAQLKSVKCGSFIITIKLDEYTVLLRRIIAKVKQSNNPNNISDNFKRILQYPMF